MIYLMLSTVISNAHKSSTVDIFIESNGSQCNVDFVYEGLSLTDEESRRMFMKNPRFSTVG